MTVRPVLILFSAVASSLVAGWAGVALPLSGGTEPAAPPGPSAASTDDQTFARSIQPFLAKYCLECHKGEKPKGGVTLDAYQSEAHARKDRKSWHAVQHVLAAGEMPPKKKRQPSKEEREFVINWIGETLTKVDCGGPRDPGRVTIRRLNRAEYNNTIRDLCGVDFKPAAEFPSDDVGYGFDNIGDVLSFQPVLLEKYMAAADKILGAALKIEEAHKSERQTYRPQNILTLPRSAKSRDPVKIVFESEGSGFLEKFNFPVEADYAIRFRGWGTKIDDEYPKVAIRVDGKDVKSFTVDASQRRQRTYEATAKFKAGEKRVAVAFTNGSEENDEGLVREFGLDLIEIEGPINAPAPPLSASAKMLLIARPKTSSDARAAAETVLTTFVRRAYRRPVKPEEITRLVNLFDLATKQREPFEKAIRLPMKAVLVSPHFLYRIEDDPKSPNDIRTISDFEFATRLSYFLWSTMPDEELYRHAESGDLRKPGVLEAQIKRMLKDSKSHALAENFAGQWLELRNLKLAAPDKSYFPGWDENLRAAMVREGEMYFDYVARNDRSILEFLDSDYTFLNGRLARHYGIENVYGIDFQKVKLPDTRRGGVITMGSTLLITSNPTRTSPVKRGKWILENILGTPPPPPAPDAGDLPPTAQLKGTLRQQMEQHRANPRCAVCHAKLDPLGFGLENFNAVGAWRTLDNKQPIDSSGVLPGGQKFSGPGELKKVLLGKADMFRRCFAEKLFTYALGRGLEYYDRCALDDVAASAKKEGDTFSALVLAIVKSDPFQKRKGKRSE